MSLDYLLIDDCENRNGRFPGMEDVPDYGAGKGLGGSDIRRQQDSGQWEMDAGWPETSSREKMCIRDRSHYGFSDCGSSGPDYPYRISDHL